MPALFDPLVMAFRATLTAYRRRETRVGFPAATLRGKAVFSAAVRHPELVIGTLLTEGLQLFQGPASTAGRSARTAPNGE